MKLYFNIETALEQMGYTYYDFLAAFIADPEKKQNEEMILQTIETTETFKGIETTLELHQLSRLNEREMNCIYKIIDALHLPFKRINDDEYGHLLYAFKQEEYPQFDFKLEEIEELLSFTEKRTLNELPNDSQLLFFGCDRMSLPNSSGIQFKWAPYYFKENDFLNILSRVNKKERLTLNDQIALCQFLNQFDPYFMKINKSMINTLKKINAFFENATHEECFTYVYRNQKNLQHVKTLSYIFSNHDAPLEIIKEMILESVIPPLFLKSTMFSKKFDYKQCQKVICETYFEHQLEKSQDVQYFIYSKFIQDEKFEKLIEKDLLLKEVRMKIVEPLAELEYKKTMYVSSVYTSQFNNENSFLFYPVKEALEYLFYPQIIQKKLNRALSISQDADETSRNMEKLAFYSNPQLQNKIKRHLSICMKMKKDIKTINYSSLFDFYG